jgi:hypothetical protein
MSYDTAFVAQGVGRNPTMSVYACNSLLLGVLDAAAFLRCVVHAIL